MANVEVCIDVFVMHAATMHAAEPPRWKQIIRIPSDRLPIRLAQSMPLSKWLRYSLFAITGAQGTLSTSKEQPEPSCDYVAPTLPLEHLDLYYHYNPGELVSFIDPLMLNRTVSTSQFQTRESLFRTQVSDRDNASCILTGLRVFDACHLMPHAKGDVFIENLIKRRRRGEQDVFGVDDVRNGITLNPVSHRQFDSQYLAFMPIPNFAVALSDMGLTAPDAPSGYLAHAFGNEDMQEAALNFQPYGKFIHARNDNRWPPELLFDAVYGTMIYHHFSATEMRGHIEKETDNLYPGGRKTFAEAQEQARLKRKAEEKATKEKNDRARTERYHNRGAAQFDSGSSDSLDGDEVSEFEDYQPDPNDPWDAMMYIIPYLGVPGGYRGAQQRAREENRRKLEDNVASWAASVVEG